MSLSVNVQGAGDSGSKFARAGAREPKPNWVCTQGHKNKGYWTRCMTENCNERRTHGDT